MFLGGFDRVPRWLRKARTGLDDYLSMLNVTRLHRGKSDCGLGEAGAHVEDDGAHVPTKQQPRPGALLRSRLVRKSSRAGMDRDQMGIVCPQATQPGPPKNWPLGGTLRRLTHLQCS
jgi:hypothetical protein